MTEQEKRAVMLTSDDIETILRSLEREARGLRYRSDLAKPDGDALWGKLNRLYEKILDQKIMSEQPQPDGTPFTFEKTIDSAPGVQLEGRFSGHWKNGRREIEHITPFAFHQILPMPANQESWLAQAKEAVDKS